MDKNPKNANRLVMSKFVIKNTLFFFYNKGRHYRNTQIHMMSITLLQILMVKIIFIKYFAYLEFFPKNYDKISSYDILHIKNAFQKIMIKFQIFGMLSKKIMIKFQVISQQSVDQIC